MVFGRKLKTSMVVPIYKKEDRMLITNYQLISLVANLLNVFEKLLKYRLSSFTHKYNLISPQQNAFKQHNFTKDALTEKIHKALVNRNPYIYRSWDSFRYSNKLLLELDF